MVKNMYWLEDEILATLTYLRSANILMQTLSSLHLAVQGSQIV